LDKISATLPKCKQEVLDFKWFWTLRW
jgi:hypothetical protein